MDSTSKQAKLLLALQAIERNENKSLRAAARIYNVPWTTLRGRRDGRPERRDSIIKSRKLTNLEEEGLDKYIIDLVSRESLPRSSGVADMANRLLVEGDAPRVGKNWVANFVKRRPDVRIYFTRQFDYWRAKCEDSAIIGP